MAQNVKDEPTWEMVVFKVEDRIFHSFRHTFTRASEVFEGMFLLPQEGVVEGNSIEAPIVLPGCNEQDFAALMKVLHPSTDDLVSGSPLLSKEEWIGALRLATMWEMVQVRELCIQHFSDNMYLKMSAVERILLAREFRVEKWFVDAVASIVRREEQPPLENLIQSLGISAACKIIDMQPKVSLENIIEFTHGNTRMTFPVESLMCGRCLDHLIKQGPFTCGCGLVHGTANGSARAFSSSTDMKLSAVNGHFWLWAPIQSIKCTGCNQGVFPNGGVGCESCGENINRNLPVYLGAGDSDLRAMIREAFEDEMDFGSDL